MLPSIKSKLTLSPIRIIAHKAKLKANYQSQVMIRKKKYVSETKYYETKNYICRNIKPQNKDMKNNKLKEFLMTMSEIFTYILYSL